MAAGGAVEHGGLGERRGLLLSVSRGIGAGREEPGGHRETRSPTGISPHGSKPCMPAHPSRAPTGGLLLVLRRVYEDEPLSRLRCRRQRLTSHGGDLLAGPPATRANDFVLSGPWSLVTGFEHRSHLWMPHVGNAFLPIASGARRSQPAILAKALSDDVLDLLEKRLEAL